MKEISPALNHQSIHYPASWNGKVPKRVRMAKTVYSDVPVFMTGGERLAALSGREYEVWVNSHGAITAYLEDDKRLGLKPYEFEIIEWHEQASILETADRDLMMGL